MGLNVYKTLLISLCSFSFSSVLYTALNMASTANPVGSFDSSQKCNALDGRVFSSSAVCSLWKQWFRWGGIASVSVATMSVWLVHQSPPAADSAAPWLACRPLPDSGREEFLINTPRPATTSAGPASRADVKQKENPSSSVMWELIANNVCVWKWIFCEYIRTKFLLLLTWIISFLRELTKRCVPQQFILSVSNVENWS